MGLTVGFCTLEAALGKRICVSDAEWALIGPLLPPEYGRGCRPAQNNRRYFDGMMWMARTGSQWRYRRWIETGVFNAMLETLSDVVEGDTTADMIDSTVIRAHHWTFGIKKELKRPRRLADRVAVQLQLQARCDAEGRPLGFVMTSGQTHDTQGSRPLFRMLTERRDALLADKGYDAHAIRAKIEEASAEAVIPAKSNRRAPVPHDRARYCWRNHI